MKELPGVLILIVLCVVGISLTYFLVSYKESKLVPDLPNTTYPEVTMYTSERYGLSFRFPDTYELQEREVGDGHRSHYSITLIDKEALANLPVNGEGPPTINIDIFQNNLDQQSIESWVRGTSYSNFKLSPDGMLATTTIATAPALRYASDGLYRGESYVFEHASNIVMLTVTYLEGSDTIVRDFEFLRSSFTLQ